MNECQYGTGVPFSGGHWLGVRGGYQTRRPLFPRGYGWAATVLTFSSGAGRWQPLAVANDPTPLTILAIFLARRVTSGLVV